MKLTDPSDPQVWLMRARSNLLLAQKGHHKGVALEDLCFNAQQAVEKALKAVCLHAGQDFPKIHSISRLVEIIEEYGITVPDEVKLANFLTQYAVQTRYPGPIEAVSMEEYKEALTVAARVVFWVDSMIKS
jgi:HEPN domain-containing protein